MMIISIKRGTKDKIGMDGFWKHGVIFRLYHSNARFEVWRVLEF